ncbi:MAG: hypothetical protein OEY07_17610 [Gammaproteobacteria bacterium]|nr:hypothetical protein [Gammaproteobacteria bacterium]
MQKVMLGVMLYGLLCGLCIGVEKASDEQQIKRMRQYWPIFLAAVESGDCRKIKQRLAPKVECQLCLDNTEAEANELERFRETNKNWYELLYAEKQYIPGDTFCQQDVPLLFSKEMLVLLRNNPTSFNIRDDEGRYEYIVAVTTTLPSLKFEGGQHMFGFSADLKLISVFTVP